MQASLVVTLIGTDRPGIVGRLAALAADNGAGWQQSKMARLAGKFAGIVRLEVAGDSLRYVVRGKMNKEIAASLGINERTVKLHRTAITGKVGVHSAAQLATLAREARLFESDDSAGPQD